MAEQKDNFNAKLTQAQETARKNLKQLRVSNNLTSEALATRIDVGKSTIESAESGNRDISINTALRLAVDYNISLDAFYGLPTPTNKDLMTNILLSLSKVIRYGSKKSSWKCSCGNEYNGEEHFLYIVKEFAEYINEIQQLEYERSLQPYNVNNEIYSKKREGIQIKYSSYLMNIFDNIDTRVYNDSDLMLGDIESLRMLQSTFMAGVSSIVELNENDSKKLSSP